MRSSIKITSGLCFQGLKEIKRWFWWESDFNLKGKTLYFLSLSSPTPAPPHSLLPPFWNPVLVMRLPQKNLARSFAEWMRGKITKILKCGQCEKKIIMNWILQPILDLAGVFWVPKWGLGKHNFIGDSLSLHPQQLLGLCGHRSFTMVQLLS